MSAKIFGFIVIVSVTSVFYSCVDSLKSGQQQVPVVDESPMAMMLESTLKDVNDSVSLAFMGNKLFTSRMIKSFYELNKNYPVWTSGMKPNQKALEMMHLLSRTMYYGLDTCFYQYSELKDLCSILDKQNDPELNKKAVEFELLMTHNCFKLMSHMRYGILWADTSIYDYNQAKYPSNFPEKLYGYLTKGELTADILELQPKSYEYRRLIKGLEYFLDRTTLTSNIQEMPDPKTDSVLAYQTARKLLIENNYLSSGEGGSNFTGMIYPEPKASGPSPDNDQFSYCSFEDSILLGALKEFQKDHGLSPDGRIGFHTLKALQQSNRDRFEQIAVNLERLKWEKSRPARYVYVNLPAYRLRVINDYNIVKTFNVVVGAQGTPTPLLNSNIEYFITNPEWNVPFSISHNELLPRIKNDSTYLARHNYRIFDKDRNPVKNINWTDVENGNFNYSIQQGAGSGNALGKIKFIFPNPYNVYIHDTQDKAKFTKDIRAYSHGCMRVQDPQELAKTLLSLESENMVDSVDTWLSRSDRKKIDFPEPIPVFVRYVTCEADTKGEITFFQDIYGMDKTVKEQLFANHDF